MIVKVSQDAGTEGEVAVLNHLRGISVTVEDPNLGPPFDVVIIEADLADEGTEVYGHIWNDDDAYYRDEAVTFTLGDQAVITYL